MHIISLERSNLGDIRCRRSNGLRRLSVSVILVGIIVAFGAGLGHAALINGDFQDGLAGWNVSILAPATGSAVTGAYGPDGGVGAQLYEVPGPPNADDGFEGQVALVQTFTAQAGQEVSLEATVSGGLPPSGFFISILNAQTITGVWLATVISPAGWEQLDSTALSSNTDYLLVIGFSTPDNAADTSPLQADVADIALVPEPGAATVLWIVGLCAIGCARPSRRFRTFGTGSTIGDTTFLVGTTTFTITSGSTGSVSLAFIPDYHANSNVTLRQNQLFEVDATAYAVQGNGSNDAGTITGTIDASTVTTIEVGAAPEPGALSLVLMGMAGLLIRLRRRPNSKTRTCCSPASCRSLRARAVLPPRLWR